MRSLTIVDGEYSRVRLDFGANLDWMVTSSSRPQYERIIQIRTFGYVTSAKNKKTFKSGNEKSKRPSSGPRNTIFKRDFTLLIKTIVEGLSRNLVSVDSINSSHDLILTLRDCKPLKRIFQIEVHGVSLVPVRAIR